MQNVPSSKIQEKNTAEVFVKILENHGVEYIFGVPGEENLIFLEAVRKSKIKFITTRHEQTATFMAATFGRFTGRIGVALSTLGPGATNLMTGVAYANLNALPLLVITGQKPIRKSKQGQFQIIDVVGMMQPVTKFTKSIQSSSDVVNFVSSAIKTAECERPGAVHIELPEDIAEEVCEVDIDNIKIENQNLHEDFFMVSDSDIDESLKIIENAKSPIIIFGSGANRKSFKKETLEKKEAFENFLEKTQIPFVTTQMGKGAVDERSDLYIGTTSLSAGDFVHQAISKSDCVILVGHDSIEKPPAFFTENQKVIHLNFLKAIKDAVYNPTYEVLGDIDTIFNKLTEKITINPEWDFSYFLKVRDAFRENIKENALSDIFPLIPEKVISDLREVLAEDSILSLDNGMYKIWISRNYPAYFPNSVLLDNTLATMGAGLSVGMATKILFPEKKVLVVAGDGGFLMNLGDLETAVRLGLDLVILVINDFGYGMIKWKQKGMNLSDFSLSFNNPDFIKLAESFGAKGYDIKSAEELKKVLEKSLGEKGVTIINCGVNYDLSNEKLGKIKNNII